MPASSAIVARRQMDVRWSDGVIEIEPQPIAVKLMRTGRLLMAMPAARVPRLRRAVVERTTRDVRAQRGRG